MAGLRVFMSLAPSLRADAENPKPEMERGGLSATPRCVWRAVPGPPRADRMIAQPGRAPPASIAASRSSSALSNALNSFAFARLMWLHLRSFRRLIGPRELVDGAFGVAAEIRDQLLQQFVCVFMHPFLSGIQV
jgi:hypothetical protein